MQTHEFKGGAPLLANNGSLDAPEPQRIGHVLGYRHVGPQRIGLKNHAHISFVSGRKQTSACRDDKFAAIIDIAAVRFLQTRNEAEGCRLAATARTEERSNLPLSNLERDGVHGLCLSQAFADAFKLENNLTHGSHPCC